MKKFDYCCWSSTCCDFCNMSFYYEPTLNMVITIPNFATIYTSKCFYKL